MIRHAIAFLLFSFICKLALQAQSSEAETGSVPKSLLLGSLGPEEAIPAQRIDTRRITKALRRE